MKSDHAVAFAAMREAELLAGFATDEGTLRFARRFPTLRGNFRCPDRLHLSSIGLGTRPGEPDGADDLLYRSAVPRSLERGVNVFDTALSYRMQTSERALGVALRRAIGEGLIARDEICVISKGGYLTPDPDFVRGPSEARRYLVETYIESGLVDPREVVNGNHCLAPGFLLDQIERSRRNLGLATIDFYCIQEPELHLLAKGPDEFRLLLARVLEALEEAATRKVIAAYGLSTWHGLLTPYADKGHLSIAECFELALEVGGPDHHLRCVQVPYSVAMGEGWGLASQFGPEGHSPVFESLRDTGTTVFASVPLVRGRAVRGLPEFFRAAFPELRTDAQCALQFVRSTPGVTTVLVGMRQAEHISENLELALHEPAGEHVIRDLYTQARKAQT